jgi:protein-disulfide isomerase
MNKILNSLRKIPTISKTFISSLASSTPKAIIVAAFLLGASHIAYAYITQNGGPETPVTFFTGKPIDDKDYVEGNAKSNVILVEYSDPECPYCMSLHPTMKRIRNDYADKIAFVYRHFPLTQIHPHAFEESKAIACAATLGGAKAFYEYIDNIYGYKVSNNTTQLPATGKEDIAVNIGLNKAAFTACLQNSETDITINASLNDGIQAGVQGTPSSFVLAKTKKGYEVVAMIDGARPYEFIKAALDEALTK